jgi:hypothetical protein
MICAHRTGLRIRFNFGCIRILHLETDRVPVLIPAQLYISILSVKCCSTHNSTFRLTLRVFSQLGVFFRGFVLAETGEVNAQYACASHYFEFYLIIQRKF